MNRFVLPVANLPTSFHDIANEVENVFDHLFNARAAGTESSPLVRYAPRLDVHEYDDKVVLTMDLPGIKPSELNIQVKDNRLSITGERASSTKSDGVKVWREERSYGKFSRSIQLPETANGDAVDAVYDSGVLTVTVPKQPKPAAKQVTVRVGNSSEQPVNPQA